jgi:hypothetical protein
MSPNFTGSGERERGRFRGAKRESARGILSRWEGETIGGAGNGSPFRKYHQTAKSDSISSGERVRVRGNYSSN